MTERIRTSLRHNSRELALSTRVHQLLGLGGTPQPRHEAGETPTHLHLWSIRELDHLQLNRGGTATAERVERTYSDGSTAIVTEITLTLDVPTVGTVTAVTDWVPAEELYGHDLRIARHIAAGVLR